jgi:predicted Zn-dependent protease
MYPLMRKTLILLFSLFFLYGCAVNPVTGKNELAFVSESQEINIGKENYLPSQQMQGGDYKVDPELSVYVNEVGQKLARVSDRQLPYEFVVLNNSTPNAWALPGGKIAVNRGLLIELNNEAELAAVLAHEIVHAAARHGAQSMERGMLLQGALMATGIAMQGSDYGNLVVGGAQIGAGLINTKYGRDDELEADYYGMIYMSKAGYDPMAAVELQETFVRLSKGRDQNWLEGLFASHPPSAERVATNRETARQLDTGGDLGIKRFEDRTASLRANKKAYDEYAKGQEALQKKAYKEAMQFADNALRIEPREGHFYALQGDAHYKLQNYYGAISSYNNAIKRNDNYFYYYLARGMTKRKLDKQRESYADLQASTKLLPTAIAYNALGEIELSGGNKARASEYFNAAASSDSPAGREARQSLFQLDFPQNPGKYLQVEYGLDRSGYLIAQVTNKAPVAIRNVRLAVEYPDTKGRRRHTSHLVSDTIRANQNYTVGLNLGPYSSTKVLQSIKINIESADVAE